MKHKGKRPSRALKISLIHSAVHVQKWDSSLQLLLSEDRPPECQFSYAHAPSGNSDERRRKLARAPVSSRRSKAFAAARVERAMLAWSLPLTNSKHVCSCHLPLPNFSFKEE